MSSTEDFKKYWHALAARSARRIAAEIIASSLDFATTTRMIDELMRVLAYQRNSVLVGWPHDEAEVDVDDDGDEFIQIDFGTYSDGNPVDTIVDWYEGFATIVHQPVPLGLERDDVSALSAEYWPCHHRPRPAGEADDTEATG